MSNASPLEPCPPDSASIATPFVLLEPVYDIDLSKQIESEIINNGGAFHSSNDTVITTMNKDSVVEIDQHLPPRTQLQPAQTAQISGLSEKQDSRISFTSEDDINTADAKRQDTRQSIYLVDEDIQLHLSFYRRQIFLMIVWYLLCIVTAGIWFIVDNWANNKFWIRWNTTSVALKGHKRNKDKLVRVKSKHGEFDILPLKRVTFPSPMPTSEVFPATLRDPFRSPEDVAAAASNKHIETRNNQIENSEVLSYVDVLEYRATTFLLHPVNGKFYLLSSWRDPSWSSVVASPNSLASTGLSAETIRDRQALFGDNQVIVKGKSVVDILIEEVLHPFYIFQLYSIILWANDEYVPYAIVIGVVSIIGIVATTVTTKAAIEKLKKMSRFSCDVSVLRSFTSNSSPIDEKVAELTDSEAKQSTLDANASWSRLNSENLVPGDIIDLGAKYDDENDDNFGHQLIETLPCDVVLLEGDCIVNESMLTGESVPVVKAPIPRADLANVLASGADLARIDKNMLYSGTKLVRVRPGTNPTNATRGLVIRTGFSTAKGSLVRQMLFPRPISHRFYRDAFLFIGNLFVIAMIGMIATIIYFKIIGVSADEIALRSLDVLTIAVPPALPATLSICVTFSIARLKRGQIFCLSPQRINVAGMVNMFVFDKTGTLTKEGLDVLGIRMVKNGKFTDLVQQAQNDDLDKSGLGLVEAMATAHDLNLLDGEPIGEPLEVKMLEWTSRTLQDDASLAPVHLSTEGTVVDHRDRPSDNSQQRAVEKRRPLTKDGLLARVPVILACSNNEPALAVVRTYEFTATLRRMSVIVKRHNEISAQVYSKGAAESIASLCDPASLPSDYEAVLDRCTRAGFRVLAVAGKKIDSLSWACAQTLTRHQAESELQFLGLIVFENKLKAETAGAIATIRDDAQLPIKMCTGDSVLTAVSVGKECGILSANAEVYTPRIVHKHENNKTGLSMIEWISVDNEHDKLDPYTLDPVSQDSTHTRKLKDVDLAVSGEIMRTLHRECSAETMARILIHCRIFGRFSPEQKQELVERLQMLGYVVAMTGDGANDCGALKSADVGLSLSEAEASVAAPFTSKRKDISAIIQLIREGRSTLSVSCSMFLFMSQYSLAEYFTVLLLYGKATSLDNAEYLFIDVFIVLPIAFGLANSRPAKRLHKVGPEPRLASSKPIVSMLGQVILGFIAQTIVYTVLHSRSWYEPPEFEPEDLTLNDMDNSALFRVSVFSYIIAGFAYSLGPPHRQLLYYNWILAPTLVILTIFSFYFLFLTNGPFFDLFGFVDMPKHFSWIIFGIVIAQIVVGLVFEFTSVPTVAKFVAKPFQAAAKRLGKKTKKPYKSVEKAIYLS
ncbi:related to YPK9 - vacuolar protein with a possible role in sequestering heavy metals [Melanopsichium pennsylvanicum]|uniref:Cation-transporting ATPase n=2 Tax=Melanopsichium pennsylvanicum TaxID=63383 RepID=A0AAJ5C6N2_9BASI|nr:ca-transporting atpase [Melanopsichium pennsylvanicum 4]SNX85664.1 related to YPK9 - vacuolar protein with a possible role in sequestering heavy metals [Melanopsichium pennsylvanicum]